MALNRNVFFFTLNWNHFTCWWLASSFSFFVLSLLIYPIPIPILAGAFIICWTPGLVLLLLDVCCPQCDVLAYEKFFLLLAEFNSAMNPIIYSYRDKEMSATFRQILCCQCSENTSGPTEGSARSASSLSHTILAGVHSNDHSVV